MGSSFGAFQSTNLAVLQPDRVAALVLLGPAATLKPFSFMANLFIRLGSLIPMPFTVKPGLRGMMEGGLPHERIVRQMEVGVDGFRYDRRGIFPSEIPDRELAAIDCPTLLFVGDKEKIYDPIAAVHRAVRFIPGLEEELMPGVGHLPGMQRPELVNPRILSFLSQLGPIATREPGERQDLVPAGVAR
jgi:pimeloyl-ACP methyl ester carboxylesterase